MRSLFTTIECNTLCDARHTIEYKYWLPNRTITLLYRYCKVIALLVFTTFPLPLHAQQNLTWDTNGATTGTGGTGTWNITSPIWVNGTTFQAWNNPTFDNAVFGGTSGTVTLALPINVHNLNFSANGYNLSGSTLIFGGASPTATINPSVTATINSALSGNNGLIKSGGGTLILTTDAAGFSGVTTITSGVLQINTVNALGSSIAAGDLVLNKNSTFYFNVDTAHNFTLMGNSVGVAGGANTWSGSPTLTAATTVNLTGTQGTLSGNFGDTGSNVLSIGRNGSGSMSLSGNNTYTGSTTITQGLLQLGSATALSAGSNLVFNGASGSGGSIALTGAYGNFTRGLGTAANQVQWQGDGGFLSSNNSARVVNIGGSGAP